MCNEEIPRILIEAPSPPGIPELWVTVRPVTPPCKDCEIEVIGLEFRFFAISNVDTEDIEFSFFSSEKPVIITSSNASESPDKETLKLLIARDTTNS